MRLVIALVCGTVFGVGLAVSGMTNPAKVLAFLDVAGKWDPTLAFVMGSALAVSAGGFAWSRQRQRAWLGDVFAVPTRSELDSSLIGGAALFGVGWGLVGLCPGPALANLIQGSFEIAVFLGAMLAGIVGYRLWTRAGTHPGPGLP